MNDKEYIYLNSDVHQFSYQLNQQPFNIIAHKRIKKAKPNITEPSLTVESSKEHQKQHSNYISQLKQKTLEDHQHYEVNNDHLVQNDKNQKLYSLGNKLNYQKNKTVFKKMNESFNVRTHNKQCKQQKPRSMNASFFNIRRHSETSGQKRQTRNSSIKKSKIQQLFNKDFIKTTIKESHLANWLNQVLHQFTQDKERNKESQFDALTKFGLDSNTLLSRGINPSNIHRLYQSLFVHSMGFIDVLKQLTNQDKEVLKSMWKTYIMLLEYCSQGSFQTTMGELQRDMIKKEQILVKQIEIRQMQINSFQDQMEKHLFKYVKQNKDLNKSIRDLKENNQMISKQIKDIEMAYNSEVKLRLSYQYKINEVYSLHERLNIVHNHLFEQFNKVQAQHKKAQKEQWETKQKNISLHSYNAFINDHLNQLRIIIKSNKQFIEALQMNEAELTEKLSEQLKNKGQEIHGYKQKDKQIKKLQQQIKNCNLMLQMTKASSNSHMEDYKKLTLQNYEFRRLNQENILKYGELLRQNNYLNLKQSSLSSTIHSFQTKISNLEETIKTYTELTYDLNKKIQKLQIEYQNKCIQLEAEKNSLKETSKNIVSMKLINDRIEQENIKLNKYSKDITQSYTKTHVQFLELELKYNNVCMQKFQQELQLNASIRQIVNLKKKYDFQIDQLTKKYEKLHKAWNGQDEIKSDLTQQIIKSTTQLQKAQAKINVLTNLNADMNFQKSKIQAVYKDNLILHQFQRQLQKQMIREKSKLIEELSLAHRQLQINNKIYRQNLDKLKNKNEQLESKNVFLSDSLRKKHGFVHPMRYQDALEIIRRQKQAHTTTKSILKEEQSSWKTKQQELNGLLIKKQTQFTSSMQQIKQKISKMQSNMQNQRNYFKQKIEHLTSVIYQLELKLNFKNIELQKNSKSSLNDKINQRNQKIEELLAELQKMTDFFQKKTYEFQLQLSQVTKQKQKAQKILGDFKKQSQTKLINYQKACEQKLMQKKKKKNGFATNVIQSNEVYVQLNYQKPPANEVHYETTQQIKIEKEKVKEKNEAKLQLQAKANKRQQMRNKFKLSAAYYRG